MSEGIGRVPNTFEIPMESSRVPFGVPSTEQPATSDRSIKNSRTFPCQERTIRRNSIPGVGKSTNRTSSEINSHLFAIITTNEWRLDPVSTIVASRNKKKILWSKLSLSADRVSPNHKRLNNCINDPDLVLNSFLRPRIYN